MCSTKEMFTNLVQQIGSRQWNLSWQKSWRSSLHQDRIPSHCLAWLAVTHLPETKSHHQQRNNSINDSLLMLSLSYDFQLLFTLCLNSCHEQAIRVSRKGQSIIPRLIVNNTSSVCLRGHVFVPIVTIYYKLKNINFNTVVLLFYVYRYHLLAMEVMTLFIHCSFIPEPNSEKY